MFFKIKGKIIYKEPFKLGVEVEFGESSITYEILTPLKIYEKYKEGDKIELFIYTYLKEDEFSLYGFEKKEEKDIFEKIISVPGIGPRLGLQIISNYSPSEISEIVENEDIKKLSKIKGVGTKRASRIIFELKEKIPSFKTFTDIEREALKVLINLGLKKKEAEEILYNALKGKKFESVEEILKEIFKTL
ncbi:MAG: Holliday junction branch migration protein RuvA [candidate division WOR-3 bacterium]